MGSTRLLHVNGVSEQESGLLVLRKLDILLVSIQGCLQLTQHVFTVIIWKIRPFDHGTVIQKAAESTSKLLAR